MKKNPTQLVLFLLSKTKAPQNLNRKNNLKTDQNGRFRYSLPKDLTPFIFVTQVV